MGLNKLVHCNSLTNLLMSFKDLIGLNQKSCLLVVSLIIDEISMLQAEINVFFLGYIGKSSTHTWLFLMEVIRSLQDWSISIERGRSQGHWASWDYLNGGELLSFQRGGAEI